MGLENFADGIDLALMRVRCGKTLRQALVNLPEVKVAPAVAKEWAELRNRILSGDLPAEKGLESFVESLRLRERVTQLIQEKTLAPKLQAYVIAGLSCLLFVVSKFLFPATLRPKFGLCVVALGLIFFSFLWIGKLRRNFERNLWFADWLVFLQRLESSLSWGQTFTASMGAIEASLWTRWPASLGADLGRLREASLRALPYRPSAGDAPSRDAELTKAHDQLDWIADLYRKGQPMTEILRKFVTLSFEGFERRTAMRAHRLSLELLLPLFVCSLPAFLLLLFGPLLGFLAGRF